MNSSLERAGAQQVDVAESDNVLGVVAGSGVLPREILHRLAQSGRPIAVVLLDGHADSSLATLATWSCQLPVGKLKRTVNFFRDHKAKDVVFIGGVNRRRGAFHFRPDFDALRIIWRLAVRGDDALLSSVTHYFETHGFQVRGAAQFLSDWVLKEGVLTRELSFNEHRDAEIGWRIATRLGELDVGQCVAVSEGVVVALEGLEGTSALIARCGELVRKQAVLVKRAKPQQDLRVDMPTIGPETIKLLHNNRFSAIVVEAGAVLSAEPEETLRLAEKYNIALVGSRGL